MSNEFKILINTVESARDFANICEKFNSDIDVYYGRYMVDGRSLLGILSFDLMKKINVRINTDDQALIWKFANAIDKFTVRD